MDTVMDIDMEDFTAAATAAQQVQQHQQPSVVVVDMGYEDCAPRQRRGSMSHDEEKQRRASIKAVMRDVTLSPLTKRRSIQHLMDGRRNSMENNNAAARRNSIEAAGQRRLSMASGTGGSQHTYPTSSATSSQAGSSIGGGYNNNNNNDNVDFAVSRTTSGAAGMYGYEQICVPCNTNNTNTPFSKMTMPMSANVFPMMNNQQVELSRPPCTHYDRKCTLIAPCCGAAFGCRICHDDCPALPPKINNGGRKYHRSASLPSSFTSMTMDDTINDNEPYSSDEFTDNHHTIDRFAIAEVICRECYTRQSSKTNNCISCGVQFGAYHCNKCNLWMSDEERPYHCADCGFCRVGGAENFRHCLECGMCIDINLYDSHNCKAGKYRSNCPVCQEFLFSSRGASHEMPCGHAIHWDCFRQLAAHDSRCPVCKKTAETRERMMPTWNAMAAGIAMQPVPPELARVVNISCNDCEKSEEARSWHFLGMQCHQCSSFNTVVDRIVLTGEEAYEFLEANARIAEYAAQRANGELDEENVTARRRGIMGRRATRRRSAF